MKKNKKPQQIFTRQNFAGWFCFLLWAVLILRLGFLQVILGSTYSEAANNQHRVKVPLFPERGRILDKKGKLLAGSLEVYSIYAFPRQVENRERTAKRLSSVGLGTYQEILTLLKSQSKFVWIQRDVENRVLRRIKKLDLVGIGVTKDQRRNYPMGIMGGNLLGFVGEDGVGLEGVEFEFDQLLKGEKGWAVLQRGANGGLYPFPEYPEIPPRSGKDVYLTIDADIQSICEVSLDKYVKRFRANGGSVVCIHPRTGEIIAMANSPGYNPNRKGSGSPEKWRNRIVTDLFEPGSTFKIVIDAAAIEKDVVDLEERVDDGSGVILVSGHKIRDPKKHGPYTFQQAVERSANAASVRIAQRVGKEDLYLYARSFGFGTKTGIRLPGEAHGSLSSPEEWSNIKFANVALGHGISGTALQLAMAFGAIANDGFLLEPQILRGVGSFGKLSRIKSKIIRRVVTRDTASMLKELLQGVVERGTGKLARIRGVSIAGKTGTAQKIMENGSYSLNRVITSFVGFLPAEDPVLLFACIVDEPKGDVWGATVSAPLFRDIANKVIHLPSYEGLIFSGVK
jgi:cell division protein FtsI/penicillin-binding protein 2